MDEMPNYFPIPVEARIKASTTNMISLRWKQESIVADFLVPDDETSILRVQFEKTLVVRVLDEMPLSTETEKTPNVGIVPDHFAYRVEDALFWQTQSEALKSTFKSAQHYRFLTGWSCLDVISTTSPTTSVVPLSVN